VPSTSGAKPPESGGLLQGPGKRQRPLDSTPDGGQAKRSRHIGQLIYVRAAQEGLRMAIICNGYPEVQVSKVKFVEIQWEIGGLMSGLPQEGFTPMLIDNYWTKGAAIVVRQDETRNWLSGNVQILRAWEA